MYDCVDIYSDEHPGPSKRAKKTVLVETNKVLLKVSLYFKYQK